MKNISQSLKKVPEVTIYFWVIKLLTTAMGETTSDFLTHRLDPKVAVVLCGTGLIIALILQFSVRRYVPWIYWLAAAMVAIFGTMAADVVHIGLGIPYIVSTVFFAFVLGIVFLVWYKSEKTLSVHSIFTFRRELFYWATVMTTFALGTALGDMTATTVGLGYLSSGILFAVLMIIPAIGYFKCGMNEVFAFWFAYILTRPLGASFSDWAGKPPTMSGLGIGTGTVSIALSLLIILLVGYLTITKKDIKSQ